ncbi:MAG: hypothetical protein J6D33_03480 [Turicibacter sp.]|nr:hypothetical protein [Turicibacter sp.]
METMKLPGELIVGCGCYETDRLDLFINDPLNRPIEQSAVNNLKMRVNFTENKDDYPFIEPLIAAVKKGETGDISLVVTHGNHRLEACKQMNRKVRYIVTDTYRPAFTGQQDLHQDWMTKHLISSFSKQGITEYVILNRLYEKYPQYSFGALTIFLNQKITSDKKLRNKEFILSEGASLKLAIDKIRKFEQFKYASDLKLNSKEVIKALIEALDREDFDFEYFLTRCEGNAAELKVRPEFASISTRVRARNLIQFCYNNNSKSKNFYF